MPGKRAFGAKVSYSSTSGGTYTDVANVTALKPFNTKSEMMDTTAHNSVGRYREKTPTLLDAGQCQFDVNYDEADTTHKWLLDNLGVVAYWKVTFPGTTPVVASFQGFVTNLSPNVPFDNKETASVSIEITGPVTLA